MRSFQRRHSLVPDGAVGRKTLAALGLGLAPDIITPAGTRIFAVSNAGYEPPVSSKVLAPLDAKLFAFLKSLTPVNVNLQEQADFKAQLLEFRQKQADRLRQLGIKDVFQLTPKQAVCLSQEISSFIIKWAKGGTLGQTHASDTLSLTQMFANSLENIPTIGACRNFADTARDAFYALKSVQTPSTSKLLNTYCLINSGGGHQTCAFLTVQPDGDVAGTIIDPGWNDGKAVPEDYTFSPAHDYPAVSIRWCYLATNIGAAVGDRALERFKSWLGRATRTPEELSTAIDELPMHCRAWALELLSLDTRCKINAVRKKTNLREYFLKVNLNNPMYHSGSVAGQSRQEKEFRGQHACR